jgi:hypothetical protein
MSVVYYCRLYTRSVLAAADDIPFRSERIVFYYLVFGSLSNSALFSSHNLRVLGSCTWLKRITRYGAIFVRFVYGANKMCLTATRTWIPRLRNVLL